MMTSVIARTCLTSSTQPSSSQGWLAFTGAFLVALCALFLDARPTHAQTVYYVDDDADDGLVAHWQFDTPSATSLDYHSLITATLTNFTSLNTSYTNDVPDLLRENPRSVTLDGTNDLFTVADNAALNRTGDFTVAAWIKRDNIGVYDPIYDSGTITDTWWFFVAGNPTGTTNDNRLGFGIRFVNEYYGNTIIPADGQWRHVAMVLDTTTTPNLRFYVNGVLDDSVNVPDSIRIPSGVKQIGGISDGNTQVATFDGSLDEVRFYERVLTLAEIARLAAGRTCVTEGTSWATAFADLNCALEIGTFGDTIRVAKGRYLPGINPDALFDIDIGDNIQGGFDGDEALNESRPAINLDPATFGDYLDRSQYTILTGDVLGNDPPDALTDASTVADEEADNLKQIFSINTAVFGTSLDGVVVSGARNTDMVGGGASILGAPTISNAIFVFNRAASGGGIHIPFNATPTLSNLRFIGNEAVVFGGGIEAENFITLENTRFISNTAGVSGGGLDVREDGGVLTNVDFARNQAPFGGGLYISANATAFSYINGELAQNEADQGGGIHTNAATTLNNLTIRANSAITQGGGIFSFSPLTIDNSTILSNTQSALSFSLGIGGGGIYSNDSFTLTNSTIQGNSANNGGGIVAEDLNNALSVLINNVTFRANHTINGNGGGLHLTANELQLTAQLTDVTFEDNFTGGDEGGGLAANGIEGTIVLTALRLTVNNNRAFQSGGGVSLEGDVITQITDSIFEGNEAGFQGGALYLFVPTTSPQLTNITFRNNHALTDEGGGLFFCCSGTHLQVENLLFEQNSSQGDGGGLSVCCSVGILGEHLTLLDNESAGNGGGLALCCTLNASSLQFITVTANSAITNGGGIFLDGGAALTVTNGLISDNSARLGGGIYTRFGSDFSLIEGLIQGNSAHTSGGGIFANIATIRLTDVQVIRNRTTTSSGGGGISLNTTFNNVLRDVDFIENSALQDDGGAMRIRDSEALLDRVSFHGNAAERGGGAISLEDGSLVTITNAIFVGNVGATENDASDSSNALEINNASKLLLINSSLAANSGQGDGPMRLEDGGAVTLTNVILWDNASQATTNDGTGTLVEQNVIIGNPASGVDPRFARNPTPGDGNWATLADNDYGDLRLRSDSPALDQGNGALLPAGINQDLSGNARIFDILAITNAFASPVDLGAYEANFVAPTANAGGPYSGNEGQAIALNGSASSDNGTITTYAWDCTNDNILDATSGNPTGQSCTYPDQGEFTLRLRVTDNDGISTDSTVAVEVANVPPSAQNDSATTPAETSITVNVLANDTDVADDPLTLTTLGTPTSGSATIQAGQARYTPATGFEGNATFTYTISDDDGGSATATVNITVTAAIPTDATLHLPMLAKE